MFEFLLDRIVGDCLDVQERTDGVAFFTAATELYGLSSLSYLGLNIEMPGPRQKCFLHCSYSDTHAKHCVTLAAVSIEPLRKMGLEGEEAVTWPRRSFFDEQDGGASGEHSFAFLLRPRRGESAAFGIRTVLPAGSDGEPTRSGLRDLKVLGNYFHSHILRINGHDSDRDMLVSARELDCLRWTAAGKTAWEASVILGISERTVRFHLNAAREKLNCATTTQAVAKAISYQLIDI